MNLLLIFSLFIIKQFVCDFGLQGDSMVKEKRLIFPGNVKALSIHSGIHGVFTMIIVGIFVEINERVLLAGILDFAIHWIVDFFKSNQNFGGKFKESDGHIFYAVLGLDQMIHHLTYIVILYIIQKV